MPLCALSGIECVTLSEGVARVRQEPPPGSAEEHLDSLYGLADIASSFALHTVIPPLDLHVTVELSLFLGAPVAAGARWAEGRVVRQGRRQAFADARVFDSAGNLGAVASGTWSVLEGAAVAPAAGPPGAVLDPGSVRLDRPRRGRGTSALTMEAPPRILHPNGAVPGPLLGDLAARAARLARETLEPPAPMAVLSLRFLRAARRTRLRARAAVARNDAGGMLVKVEIAAGDGAPVAAAIASWPTTASATHNPCPSTTEPR